MPPRYPACAKASRTRRCARRFAALAIGIILLPSVTALSQTKRKPLRVPFGPDPVSEIGQYNKSCAIDNKTHELVLSVTARPQVAPGQEYAGCCVLFRDLLPGGRGAATVTVKLASPERELHVKLENVRNGSRVAWLHSAASDAGTRVIRVAIDNPVLRERVDKFCIAAKGENSPIRNTIRASGLSFQ
jgi:hypothetical protein